MIKEMEMSHKNASTENISLFFFNSFLLILCFLLWFGIAFFA